MQLRLFQSVILLILCSPLWGTPDCPESFQEIAPGRCEYIATEVEDTTSELEDLIYL